MYFVYDCAVGMDLNMPKLMIIGVAFSISASMALPFSSFPNVNSVQILVSLLPSKLLCCDSL